MSDRELLELAAKAAGIDYWIVRFAPRKAPIEKLHTEIDGETVEWNPLTDDGDALRLAVKLRLDITFGRFGIYAGKTLEDTCHRVPSYDREATRLAIVRAAAEIGRAMP